MSDNERAGVGDAARRWGSALYGANLIHWAPVALGLGIGLYFALPAEPPLWLPIVALAGLGTAYMLRGRRDSLARILLGALMLAALGLLLAEIRTLSVAGPVIEKETRPLTLAGEVIRVERRADASDRILVRVTGLSGRPAEKWPERVRVAVRTQRPSLHPGDQISMRAILLPPPEPVLPGDFDFARNAWFKRIGGLGFAVGAVELLEARQGGMLEVRQERLRDTVAGRVRSVLSGDAGALAVALITGLRGGLSDQVQVNMRGAGLAHLLAISGLHMALVTGALFFGVRALLAAVPAIALTYPIKKIAAVAAWLGAVFYLLLSGAGISTQRAFIMVSLMLLAVLLERHAISMRLVALAAVIVLALAPEALVSASFQMSFAAVVGLVAGFEWHQQRFGAVIAKRGGRLRRAAWYLWGVVLATLIAEATIGPVAAFHFHRIALFGIPANVVAMPLMSFWIMPLAVLALLLMPLGLESLALAPMGWGLDILLGVAGEVAALPGAVRPVPAMPFASFLLIVAGGLWLALVRDGRLRRLAAVPLLLAALPALMVQSPDVLIGREGKIFAVLDGAGDYALSSRRGARFTRRSWMEYFGQGDYAVWPRGDIRRDNRRNNPRGNRRGGQSRKGTLEAGQGAARGVAPAPVPVRCDALGCIYRPPGSPGSQVAFLSKRDGFAEECRRPGLLVTPLFAPRGCTGPALVIDGRVMRREGAMTLKLSGDGRWIRESAAGARGRRPWTGQ